MSFILIGSVESSEVFLKQCLKNGLIPKHVYGLDEKYAENVSGYSPIYRLAIENGIPGDSFCKINECNESIKEQNADFIFVIGLSQLISKEIINAANIVTIGLHPTKLPRYRGRAAIPWQILLGETQSAVSFFGIQEGIDNGPLYWQEPYSIGVEDYAEDVHQNIYAAIRRFVDKGLRSLLANEIIPIIQNEKDATYLLIRREEDGLIDWNKSVDEIFSLIRAESKPYPGAFSYYNGNKIIIWKAEIIYPSPYIGINGQIAEITDGTFSVVVGNSLLRVFDAEIIGDSPLCIGKKFEMFNEKKL